MILPIGGLKKQDIQNLVNKDKINKSVWIRPVNQTKVLKELHLKTIKVITNISHHI